MKHLIVVIFCIFACTMRVFANISETINLGIYVVPSEMPEECESFLNDRIATVLSENHINSSLASTRFFIVAKSTVISKQNTGGILNMVSNKITISFRIGDAVDNRVFTSFTQVYHGVGQSEQKAWMNALNQIKNNNEFKKQLQVARNDISNYYNSRANQLIKLALSQADTNDYDAALATLAVIPQEVSNYDAVRRTIVKIYQNKCVYNNSQLILSAKSIWAASPDKYGAEQACSDLSKIANPSAQILKQMEGLSAQMKERLEILDQREYEMLQQQIADAHELEIHQADNEANLWATALQLGYDFLCNQVKPINLLTSFFVW